MAMRLPVMKDVTRVVAKQSRQKCEAVKCSENETIQRYYGEIGIPAVAAAVRYQGDFKNPVYAPVKIHLCTWIFLGAAGNHDES
jgi:hypothetical protein